MPILSTCPGCFKPIQLPDGSHGKKVRCGACQHVFVIEAPPVEAEPVVVVPAPVEAEPNANEDAGFSEKPVTVAPKKPAKTPPVAKSEPPRIRRDRDEIDQRKSASGAGIMIATLLMVLVGGFIAFTCVAGIGVWFLFPGVNENRVEFVKVAPPDIEHNHDEIDKDRPIEAKDLPRDFGPPIGFDDKKDWPPFFDKGPGPRPPFDRFEEKKDWFDKEPKQVIPPPIAKTGQLAPLPAALPIKPAPLEQAEVARILPDTIQNVIVAGGGRFLILHLPKLRQLAIFDVNEAKVVKYLPVAGDNAMIAAGMTKLIVAFPDTKIVQRWNLLTYERELTTTLPIQDALAGIGMGYGSDGPLVVQTVREPITGDTFFVDIRTMKMIDLPTKILNGHIHRGANAQMRGSLDGRAFGVTSNGQHAYTINILPDGAQLRETNEFGGGMKLVPSADGKTFFANGLYSSENKRLGASPAVGACVPALQGQFYLVVPTDMILPGFPNEQKPGGVQLRIVGDSRPLLTLAGVDTAMRDFLGAGRDPLSVEQRYHFIPDAQLLVTIPNGFDRLVLRKLNIEEALDKSGIDYLFVASTPFPYAVIGQNYRYPIQVKSKKGGLKYRVDDGPAGMKVSPNGVVTWAVPANNNSSQVDVIMTISDAAGQEIFHTFKLAIVRELPPEAKQGAKIDDGKK